MRAASSVVSRVALTAEKKAGERVAWKVFCSVALKVDWRVGEKAVMKAGKKAELKAEK